MNEAGLPIFSFENGESIVDHALISAFFTAMQNMTEEVFLDKIQTLEMGENRLIFRQRSTEHTGILSGAVISDIKDNPDLIANLVDTFLEQFATKHDKDAQKVAENGFTQSFDQFENSIKQKMKQKLRKIWFLRKQGIKTRGLGFITGLSLFFLGIIINLSLWGNFGIAITGLIMVLTLLMFPSGTAGWVTGNGRDGLVSASASGAIGVLVLALVNAETLILWVEKIGIASEMGAIIAVLTALLVLTPAYGLVGYSCGAWISRRCMHPM